MAINTHDDLRIYAAPSAYVSLTAIWFTLAIGYVLLFLQVKSPDLLWVATATAAIGFAFAGWLRGFSIIVEGQMLEYRDGFYRRIRIPLQDVSSAEMAWVEWRLFTTRIRIPRLVIRLKTGLFIRINVKPFRRLDVQRFKALLGK